MISIRVLVLATTFPRWKGDGTASFVFELSKRLAQQGSEIVVLAPHHGGSQLKEDMDGVEVHRFPYFYPRRYQRLCYEGGILPNLKRSHLAKLQVPSLALSELIYALTLVKRERIDLIHSHWIIPSGLVGAICKKVLRKPLVVTVHAGDVFPLVRKKYLRSVGRTVLNSCDVCTVNSNATGDAVRAVAGSTKRIEIIPMGVDLEVFSRHAIPLDQDSEAESGERTILFVGRIAEKKGINYLIEAMPTILRHIPEARLVIVGYGPERGRLEDLVGKLGLNDRVAFAGEVPNAELARYYHKAHLLVLPSIVDSRGDTEGLGIVILEAMACGVPVVASNVGGIPDIIEPNWNGLLSKPGNPQDIADKVVELLSDKRLRERLSQNALETVRVSFSWEAVAKKFSTLYHDFQ
ncbi:glycosyltransferase [Chloroflexota bacterium]